MPVAERSAAHVCQSDTALAAAVCKEVAVLRMELCRSDDLGSREQEAGQDELNS